MKALILNSGVGSRMGALTSEQPKCMTELKPGETILSRQLKQLIDFGITEAVITTGYCESVLMNYCTGLDLPISIKFVHNPQFRTTNYIYSIYLACEYLDDDISLMHGDLVFENESLSKILDSESSVMAVSSTVPLPEKDFKAVIDDTGKILKVGVEFFSSAVTAQPLYKLNKQDWNLWLSKINEYCNDIGTLTVYAEKALMILMESAIFSRVIYEICYVQK